MKLAITVFLTGLLVATTSAAPFLAPEARVAKAPCQRNVRVADKATVQSDWRLDSNRARPLTFQRESIGIVVPHMDFD